MPKVTQAISNLFESTCQKGCNNDDILRRYAPSMEIQVNVAADDGEMVEGKRNTWEKDGESWWHIRIPKGAMTDSPHWNDYTLNWSLAQHAEAIGMTGWDWANKRSRWVAFDFDSITGHARGIGVGPEQLQEVREAAQNIRWVETRLSTRGGGYHLYVYFCDDGIPTANHTEHAALARCVLGFMSRHAGFNFAAAIDCCGGNMWVWHRDATEQNRGFTCIKRAKEELALEDLPENWRDNIEVITRKRTKVRVRGVSDADQEQFDTLANSRPPVVLTDSHNGLLDLLQNSGFSTLWHPDYNLVQTHTCALKKVMADHPGKYEGTFQTISEGNDPGKPNCFMFPLPGKGWKVIRFGRGINEHESWDTGENGWTYTFFDRKPGFDVACRMADGAEMDSGGYAFNELADAVRALEYLSVRVVVNTDRYGHRKAEIRIGKKDGRLVLRMKGEKGEKPPGTGWVEKRGDWWERVLRGFRDDSTNDSANLDQWDAIVRNVKTPAQEDAGWFLYDRQEKWVRHPVAHIGKFLGSDPYELAKSEIDNVMGQSIGNAWELVNLPFQDEYPGGRQWNFQAAQWRYMPADMDYDEQPEHPHWDAVLDHIGANLDASLRSHPWAQKYGIKTGRQYLQLWIATLLREPFDKLPYLFLYGPENSGKSTLHVAIGKLMTNGVTSADRALINQNDFNGELANAVLAVVEEVDVRGIGGARARNRMKDWTTNDDISIRRMRMDVYRQRNTLHFIQCSNDRDACLVSFGDTRTTMINVPDFRTNKPEIPKAVLYDKLDEEAPHFMRTLVDLELPPAEGRLRIPFITTSAKERYEELMRDELEAFIQDRCTYVPGASIPLPDFYSIFIKSVPETEVAKWNTTKISRRLPDEYPTGQVGHKNIVHIGNIAIDLSDAPTEDELKRYPFIRVKGRLQLEGSQA